MKGGYQLIDFSNINYTIDSSAEPKPLMADFSHFCDLVDASDKPCIVKLPKIDYTAIGGGKYDLRQCFANIVKDETSVGGLYPKYSFHIHTPGPVLHFEFGRTYFLVTAGN